MIAALQGLILYTVWRQQFDADKGIGKRLSEGARIGANGAAHFSGDATTKLQARKRFLRRFERKQGQLYARARCNNAVAHR